MFLLKQSIKHFPRIFSTDAKYTRTTPLSLSIISKRLIQLSPEKQENKTIVVPPLAESVTEGDVRVEKKVGDNVKTDEVIMEIETDKTSVPIPAPAPGVITELLVKDGDIVKPGQALFKMDIGATVPGEPVEKAPPPPTAAPPAISPKVEAKVATRPEQRVKMNKMRIMIAKRLKDAQNTAALLTTFSEIDMLALTKLKNDKHDEFLNKHKIKLGFMSAFLKASSVALKEMPEVNAVIDKNEIIYREYIDISVAVATSKGLIVPVVKNVDKLSFENTELELNKLAELAKSNSLTVDSVLGGTFTIDNGGVFGSLMSTQIINQPQSAIMGMHKIIERPVAIKGKIEIRPMMFVSLTYDHRLIDGREAVLFLRKVKSCIEDPVSIAK